MERIFSNKEIPRRDFGDSSQLTNCILDSGETCHMTLDISYFNWAHLWKRIDTLKFQMGNQSQRKKQGKSK